MQKNPAVSCPFSWCFLLIAALRQWRILIYISLYTMFFRNKFIVDETLSIREPAV
jgi:hypothetical protein